MAGRLRGLVVARQTDSRSDTLPQLAGLGNSSWNSNWNTSDRDWGSTCNSRR